MSNFLLLFILQIQMLGTFTTFYSSRQTLIQALNISYLKNLNSLLTWPPQPLMSPHFIISFTQQPQLASLISDLIIFNSRFGIFHQFLILYSTISL